jgi:hypothetical protein
MHSAGVIRALERRRITQARLTRALDDAIALVLASILRATDALIHRKLALDLVTAVGKLLRLKLGRAAREQQDGADEAEPTHGLSMPDASVDD